MRPSQQQKRLIDAYREAYERANGRSVSIRWDRGGWYVIDNAEFGPSRYRGDEIVEMTARLLAGA